jgi:MSHA biogenesis protein MshO
MTRQSIPGRQRGFTLVEAIVSIVLLGVLGAIVAVFIRAPIQGYADSVARAEVSDQADLALRRVARDLRLALPNSIRLRNNGTAIEFLLTKAGGRYLAADDAIEGPVLDFLDPDKAEFAVLGAMPSFGRFAAKGDYIVVYNLGDSMAPSDAWQYDKDGNTDANITRIKEFGKTRVVEIDPDNDLPTITLEHNVFAKQSTPMPSPTQRFQVVSGPVSYYCAPGPDGLPALWRAWDYPISAQNVAPAAASTALVATSVANCDRRLFEYDTAAETRRSGLVIMTLELRARNDSDPAIRLVHQVHVDNTP